MSTDKLIHAFDLAHDEELRFSIREFKGNEYLDMRIYFVSKEDGSSLPSKKGLTLNLNLFKKFKEGINKVAVEVEEADMKGMYKLYFKDKDSTELIGIVSEEIYKALFSDFEREASKLSKHLTKSLL